MSAMPRGFWQQVLASDMAVPDDRPLNELTAELVTMLGSTNPVERDETAYPVLATWLAEGVYDDLLVSFGDSITQGLVVGLGKSLDDSVFRRSFSALILAECIRRDNVARILPVDVVLNWAERAIGWFTREQDLRGWVPGKGWAHTVAHGADLVGVLASSRHLQALHLGVLLDVIAERLVAPTPTVLVDGEDDRLAMAALTIVHRNLVEPEALDEWVATVSQAMVRPRGHLTEHTWPTPAAKNTSAFLRALHVHLAIGIAPAHDAAAFAEPPEARSDLLLALLRAIPTFTPWMYSGRRKGA
jgi:hypothetical protein